MNKINIMPNPSSRPTGVRGSTVTCGLLLKKLDHDAKEAGLKLLLQLLKLILFLLVASLFHLAASY